MTDENVVEFKSYDRFYLKEEKDLKNNTVREVLPEDPRFSVLGSWIKAKKFGKIRIRHATKDFFFERQVCDVSVWQDLTIITWIPENLVKNINEHEERLVKLEEATNV